MLVLYTVVFLVISLKNVKNSVSENLGPDYFLNSGMSILIILIIIYYIILPSNNHFFF